MKPKLATSQEIYNRVLWDPRLDRTAFVLGYADRMAPSGIREKMLTEWDPNGDIPWHRVRYVRCSQVTVWDRENRVDLFAGDELPAEAWAPANQSSSLEKTPALDLSKPDTFLFSAGFTYAWEENNGWQPSANLARPVMAERLRIVSYNLLAERGWEPWLRTEERTAALLRLLEVQSADILALQEVTPAVWKKLVAEGWVRNWFLSEPADGSSLEPYGLALISRYPFVVSEHRLTAHKRILLASWSINGRKVNLLVFHAPSGAEQKAVEGRSQHFQAALAKMRTSPGNWLLLGDFNVRQESEFEPFRLAGLVDLWPQINPEQGGATFVPAENALAERLSRTGESARFDRMWFQSGQRDWKPVSLELIGNQPIEAAERFFPSDHWGLQVGFAAALTIPEELKNAQPVHTSALVLDIAAELAGEIQTIRKQHDAKFTRWMPHLTLVFGFVPEAMFKQAASVLEYLLAEFPPFSVTLDGYRTFEHRKDVTAWLVPKADPPEALSNLYELLVTAFPACRSKLAANGFTPHVTVGQFPDTPVALQSLPKLSPITFSIKSIALIARSQTSPFRVIHRVPLSPPTPAPTVLESLVEALQPSLSPVETETRATVLEVVTQACSEILGFPAQLIPIGSELLGISSFDSDLDRICVIPADLSPMIFFETLQQRLTGICEWSRFVSATKVPALRMSIEGVAVDLLAVRSRRIPLNLAQISETNRFDFDRDDWPALSGYLEAEFIARHVTARFPLEVFQNLTKAVRAWAKTRKIWGNAWGFPGGISWTILAAWSLAQWPTDIPNPGLEKLLSHFFESLTSHDWTIPIGLGAAAQGFEKTPERDLFPVVTSISPVQNTARNVTPSTFRYVKEEIARAAQLTGKKEQEAIDWKELFSSAKPPADSAGFVRPTIACSDSDWLGWCASWLEGHLAGILLGLERQGNLSLRPWPQFDFAEQTVAARLYLFGELKGVESRLETLEIELGRQLDTEKPAEWSLGFKLRLVGESKKTG